MRRLLILPFFANATGRRYLAAHFATMIVHRTRVRAAGAPDAARRHGFGSRRSLALMLALAVAMVLTLIQSASAQTSASLNRPEGTKAATTTVTTTSGTSTPSGVSPSSASVAAPEATDIAPVDLSSQQVPLLLSSPSSTGKDSQLNAGGALRGPVFTGCNDAEGSTQYAVAESRINVSAVYTQFDYATGDSAMGPVIPMLRGTLRIVGIGSVGNESHAFGTSVDSSGAVLGLLSAIQVTTSFVTFPIFDNYTYLCDRMYPVGNDTEYPNVNPPSCQYGPGTVAFGIDIPLNHSYDAGTLWTQIRLTDPSTPPLTLACIEVQASPYFPDSWYWNIIFYVPIALVIVLMLLVTFASLITAETNQRMAYRHRAREGGAPTFFKDSLRPMMISALGGREAMRSPSLLRFVTPGCWDVIFHLQFLVAIAMCHVQWPDFVYPFFRQAAWSTLLGNVTIVETAGQSHGLLDTNATLPDGDIGMQMGNPTSSLYMNTSQPNTLLNLGSGADGMQTFAAVIGLDPSSLFGTCLIVWLAIVAIIVVASAMGWIIDACVEAYYRLQRRKAEESGEIVGSSWATEAKRSSVRSPDGSLMPLTASIGGGSRLSKWRTHFGSHGRALHGNIVRALALFHLPITIMSSYQLAKASQHSTTSVALAGLSFAVLSVLAPIYIIVRIARLPVERLNADPHVNLSLGPVYHTFAPGSQLFFSVVFIHHLVVGTAVGAGQASGAAQAILILVAELVAALVWSLWLPWNEGAMMGPITFMTGIFRVITAVLVLLLTSLVGFHKEARGWLSYVILLLQGLFFAAILLVVAVKILEAFVRIAWRVRFDEKTSGRTAGFNGAIRKIRRRKLKKQRGGAASRKIQLRPIHLNRHRRSTSFGTASTLNIFEKSGAHPGTSGAGLSGPRRSAYDNYMDKGNGVAVTPGHIECPPSGYDQDYSQDVRSSSRPVSAYLPTLGRANDQDEDGTIMAAMPPLSPTRRGATAARRTTPGADDAQFVRVAGGRATENDPFAATPALSTAAAGAGRDRVNLQSPRESRPTWGPAGRSTGGSYQPVHRRASNEGYSSTYMAAQSARQSLLDQPLDYSGAEGRDGGPKKPAGGFRERLMRAWGRTGRPGQSDEESDSDWGEDDDANTEQHGASKDNKRVGTAFGGLRRAFGGQSSSAALVRPTSADFEPDSGAVTPPSMKGFEVVRPARTPARRANAEHRTEVQPMHQQEQGGERNAEDFYRTPEAQLVDTSEGRVQHPGQHAREDSNGVAGRHRRSGSGPDPLSPLDFYQRPLGMLGADLQRAPSSAGHTHDGDEEDGRRGEDRFWLPPLDTQTESERRERESASASGAQSSNT